MEFLLRYFHSLNFAVPNFNRFLKPWAVGAVWGLWGSDLLIDIGSFTFEKINYFLNLIFQICTLF